MDWPLILRLSGFGLVMAFATISLIPPTVEPLFWLVIFLVCAYVIARRAPNRFFLHGLAVSIVNSVWITAAHMAFAASYMANHPQEAAMTASMPFGGEPRLAMAIMGPVIGVVSGVVLGLLSFIAAKILRRRRAAPADGRAPGRS